MGQKLLPALGDGVGIEARGLSDGVVSPVTESERLKSREESALPLIEKAHKEDDCSLGVIGIRRMFVQRRKGFASDDRKFSSEDLVPTFFRSEEQ